MVLEKVSKIHEAVSLWPIATSLVEHLPVGDLLNLARASTSLRAAFHEFDTPEALEDLGEEELRLLVRQPLNIGHHRTPYWERLKSKAPFLCASPGHTKGADPRPCKYCSRPICEACIVRSSMAHPNEGTFRNRCRRLCKSCWEHGRPTKECKFPASEVDISRALEGWYNRETGTTVICNCTLLKDGWVCIDCKEIQNRDAVGSGKTTCFGQGCSEPLESEKERHKICLWCNNPLPVVRVGGETRYAWNQKIIAAKMDRAESRRVDLEEYNRTRLRQLRISRRELRGNEAVKGDSDADLPQFVRHLDTVNYHRFMGREHAPDGDAIYASKSGTFVYNRQFLLKFRNWCEGTPEKKEQYKKATSSRTHEFARTNLEKTRSLQGIKSRRTTLPTIHLEERWRAEDSFHDLKAHILQAYVSEHMTLVEVSRLMQRERYFLAPESGYVTQLKHWGVYREEGDEESNSKAPLSSSTERALKSAKKVQQLLDSEMAERLQALLWSQDINADADIEDDFENAGLCRRSQASETSQSDKDEQDPSTGFIMELGSSASLDSVKTTLNDEESEFLLPETAGYRDELERDDPPSYLESLGL